MAYYKGEVISQKEQEKQISLKEIEDDIKSLKRKDNP
jgi:hypothetical protein